MPQLPLWRDKLTLDDVLALFTAEGVELTRAQIADLLQTTKKKSLIDLIEQAVEQGKLERYTEPLANRAPVYLYRRAKNGA